MNIGMFLLSTGILMMVGILGSFFYIKWGNKDFFGGMRAAIIVGVIGGVLGGFMFDLLFKLPLLQRLQEIPYLQYLLVNRFDVNFIASFLGVWFFLAIYSYVSKYTERS